MRITASVLLVSFGLFLTNTLIVAHASRQCCCCTGMQDMECGASCPMRQHRMCPMQEHMACMTTAAACSCSLRTPEENTTTTRAPELPDPTILSAAEALLPPAPAATRFSSAPALHAASHDRAPETPPPRFA